MVDRERPSSRRRPARRPAQPPERTPTPRGGQSSTPIFILGGASILLAAIGVGVYAAWEPVSATALNVWGALRWTWLALAAWAVAFPAALIVRRDLVTRHPHRWLAGLLLVAAAGGCLQLAGQGLGGALGGMVVGSSAAWGIVRTAVIFTAALAMLAPLPAAWTGRALLIGLGFFAVYFWDFMGRVLRGLHAVGVWIGLKCTEVSPGLARGAGSVWRGICAVYNKAPVHVYVVAALVIAIAFVLRRPAKTERRRATANAYESYLHPQDAFEYAGTVREPRRMEPARASAYPAGPLTATPTETAEEDAAPRYTPYTSSPYLRANPTHGAPAPAGAGAPPAMPPFDDDDDDADADESVDAYSSADEYGDGLRVLPDDSDEMDGFEDELEEDEDRLPFDVDEDDDEDFGLDDLEDSMDPEFVDLRSAAARSGGRIASAAKWELPSLDLLKQVPEQEQDDETHKATAQLIEQTLSDYDVEVSVKEIRPGPVVTQYGLVPGWVRRYKDVRERNPDGTPARGLDGKLLSRRVEEKTRVRVDRVLAREKDLALALAAPSLSMAPIPGTSYIGVEVPNSQRAVVTLRSSLESTAFQAIQKKARLPVALGLGSGGEPVFMDLADMPHLLIAGSTGSGKSVCMNTIICSLMMQCTPNDLQMYLVDPKRVELTGYNGLPHLAGPVLVEVDQAVPALHAIIAEMQSRYKKFEARGARNIISFNGKLMRGEDRMPYLILIIDELADLMMTASSDVEPALIRLAQLGRAAGIHLVVATQRPSVDVITGLIKANIPTRIGFAVSSQVDSRTILDTVGAEKLLGRGDLLLSGKEGGKLKRLQGAFISDEEVDAIVGFWQKQGGKPKPTIQMEIAEPGNEEDTMLQEAQRLAIHHSRISASLLQRKLGIGYAKAASLLDHLEDRGIVGPGDPGKSREVITPNL